VAKFTIEELIKQGFDSEEELEVNHPIASWHMRKGDLFLMFHT